MREALSRLAGLALSATLLAESRCPGCGCVFRPGADGAGSLCPECRAANRPPEAVPCPGCGEYPAAPLAQPQLCPKCQAQPRPWGRMLVHGAYEGELRDMILAYKFQQRLDLGRRLMECALDAYERGLERFPELGHEAVVPVPLHARRLLSRGFNQSREIARLLSARRAVPILQDALVRVRRTTPQMTLAREARAENIRGAFVADSALLSGRRVLLVDDIMTTGATLEECARAMLRAGAVRVDALVLARA